LRPGDPQLVWLATDDEKAVQLTMLTRIEANGLGPVGETNAASRPLIESANGRDFRYSFRSAKRTNFT